MPGQTTHTSFPNSREQICTASHTHKLNHNAIMYDNTLQTDSPFPPTYSLAPRFLIFSFSWSRIMRRKILPLGDLGTTSMNSMPPRSFLWSLL